MTEYGKTETNTPNRGYDLRPANARNITYFAIGLLTFILVSMGILAVLYHSHLGGKSRAAFSVEKTSFAHGALMETSIETDWKKLDAEVSGHLEAYRWVDREKGVVQVPIERAMEILAERSAAK